MTTLKIIPDFKNKTAECIGYPSAGEHVDVQIVGGASLLPSSTLRFRVKFGHVTLAMFPRPDVNETWETEGADLKCHLNLNTIQASRVCRTGNTVCHAILDQVGDDEHTVEPTLFFDDLFDVTPWYRESGADEPYDLDIYPNQIADLNQRVNAIGAKVAEVKNAAETAAGSANESRESAQAAVTAAQNANARANAAENAARGASSDALRARNDADAARDDANRAEEQVSSAAESAASSAVSAASAAQSAEEVAAAVENKADLVDGKVPASQLPSYVDDVLEFSSASDFPATGESGKIYIAKDTNKQYRWSGTQYVQLGGDFAVLSNILTLCQPFSATKSGGYAVGEFCSHLDDETLKLYQCTTAHTGVWNAAHFSARDVASLFSSANTSLTNRVDSLIDAKVGDVNAVLAAALDGTEVE